MDGPTDGPTNRRMDGRKGKRTYNPKAMRKGKDEAGYMAELVACTSVVQWQKTVRIMPIGCAISFHTPDSMFEHDHLQIINR